MQEMEVIRDCRKKGGLVAGYICTQFPAEILAGYGLLPVRLAEGATYAAEREGEKIIRPDACSYCKSLIGSFGMRTGLFGNVDLLVGVVTCDMMRHTLEILARESGVPVFQLQMPATRSINAENYFVSEVGRTAKDIRSFTGASFDCSKARSFFNSRKACAAVIDDIVVNGELPAAVSRRLKHLFNIARPGKMKLFLDSIRTGLKPAKSRKRLLVLGSMLCLEDDIVYRILEENGAGAIPMGISENGQSGFYRGPRLKADTANGMIAELAARSFRSDVCIRNRPNSRVYEEIRKTIATQRCDGVILKCLKFCDLWYSEKERMKQELNVPLLVLDTTYSDSEEERVRNRIEAFLEIL